MAQGVTAKGGGTQKRNAGRVVGTSTPAKSTIHRKVMELQTQNRRMAQQERELR